MKDLIDLDRYPIHEPWSEVYRATVEVARAGLRHDGCAVIKDLVRPAAVDLLNKEIVARKDTTHFSTQVINPYFHMSPSPAHPERHPVNTFLERSSGFIPGDSWEAGCATRRLFEAPELGNFLADCLEIDQLHCYADPLAGLTANILDPGDMQIFRGRYSLHRVTRVPGGSKPRHAAIFAYTEEAGVIGRVERTRQLFGRVLPAHEEAERSRVRTDSLID